MKTVILGLFSAIFLIGFLLWIAQGEAKVARLDCESLPDHYFYSCVQAREAVRIRELLEDY